MKKNELPKNFKEASILIDNIIEKIPWTNAEIKVEIKKKLRPSLVITNSNSYNREIRFGATKWGGNADMEVTVEKMFKEDKRLMLLCQINLEEISQYDLNPLLPKKGILYFFFQEDLEFPSKSISRIHYNPTATISATQKTAGYTIDLRPVYTFPNCMTANYCELEKKFKEDSKNLDLFTKELHKSMRYYWYSTLFLAEPIPMQGPPFETLESHPNYVIPLLDFVHGEPKYHVGISPSNLEKLEFSNLEFTGAST